MNGKNYFIQKIKKIVDEKPFKIFKKFFHQNILKMILYKWSKFCSKDKSYAEITPKIKFQKLF
jgi:hypothetical protein